MLSVVCLEEGQLAAGFREGVRERGGPQVRGRQVKEGGREGERG